MQERADRPLEHWVMEYENDPEFIADDIAADIIEDALRLLNEAGHNQTWLAGTMNVSRSQVSRLFSAPPNMTLLSLARLSVALGVKPKVILDSENEMWVPRFPHGDFEDQIVDFAYLQSRRSNSDSTSNISGKQREEVSTNEVA